MSEQDWIERLREQRGQITGEAFGRPLERVLLPAHLWPLLCDVVEAADLGGPPHKRFTEKQLQERIAALRAEVEK